MNKYNAVANGMNILSLYAESEQGAIDETVRELSKPGRGGYLEAWLSGGEVVYPVQPANCPDCHHPFSEHGEHGCLHVGVDTKLGEIMCSCKKNSSGVVLELIAPTR